MCFEKYVLPIFYSKRRFWGGSRHEIEALAEKCGAKECTVWALTSTCAVS